MQTHTVKEQPVKAAKLPQDKIVHRAHWSLPLLMQGLHDRVERDLRAARTLLGHPSVMGDASQNVWLGLFETYLPKRYQSLSGTIVDSEGNFSDHIDVVIFDRQYSPLVLHIDGQVVIPIEAVYAVFESKQELRSTFIHYAQDKVASVRSLCRTSIEVPTINGRFKKEPQAILGGFLALEATYMTRLARALTRALEKDQDLGRLDMGCIAAVGTFGCGGANSTTATDDKYAATSFLLELMSRLQACGTVPAIDYRAYAKWLRRDTPRASARTAPKNED
jgi:hypothetical protein